VPIDATYLAAQYPDVQILTEPEAIAALLAPSRPAPLYLEIGFHLELASLEQRLGACQRVAVLSTAQDSVEVSDWRDWADTVVAGAASAAQTAELWRSPISSKPHPSPPEPTHENRRHLLHPRQLRSPECGAI
jgi:hypothetical protein